MVSDHGYVRMLREAIALKGRGHIVDVACFGNLFGRERVDTFGLYRDYAQLDRVVRASGADVFHVFNEPDDLVPIVKQAAGNRPVVFDVQDLNSLRWGKRPDEAEESAFDAADGVIHISEPCRRAAEKWHGKKPSALLACYVNDEFHIDQLPRPCWESLVYEGALATSQVEEGGLGNIRGLEDVVRAFCSQGFEVHLYPAGDPPPPGHYESLGAVVHGGLAYPSLLRALRIYGFGFVGGPFKTPLMDAALPNKLYEYMSQGVVPVVWNAQTAAEFVEKEGIGIALDGLENLPDQLCRKRQCRKRLLARRHEFTMERHIEGVEALYREVAA